MIHFTRWSKAEPHYGGGFSRSPEVEQQATEVEKAGGVFEAEMLLTGEVSLTCERDRDGEIEVLAIEVVPNGPEVPAAVDRLVATAYANREKAGAAE